MEDKRNIDPFNQALPSGRESGQGGYMRIRASHLRWVGSGVAAMVLLPVVGQWFIAFAAELGAYRRPVERSQAMIAALLDAQWFHWVGGAAIGFAVGVWLDALVRSREKPLAEAAAPITPVSSRGQWLTPEQAKHQLLPSPILMKLRTAERAHKTNRLEVERLEDSTMTNSMAKLVKLRESSQKVILSEAELLDANRLADETLLSLLRNGRYLARGHEVLDGVAADSPRIIPAEMWGFLHLSIDTATADGHGRKFVAVEINHSA